MTRLVQFVPTLERSAVGDHVLELDRLLGERGVEAAVFAQVIRPELRHRARDFGDYAKTARPDDVLLYHMAQGAPLGDFVLGRPGRLVVDHHNITPERFFRAWAPEQVHNLAWGRRQLARMASRAELGLGDSTFNAQEVAALGCRRTAVAPILLDLAAFDRAVDAAAVERLSTDATVWFFVGRVVANKCQHDLVRAFALYRRLYDPTAVLRIVGSASVDRYFEAVRSLADDLGVGDAVTLTGRIGDGELAAHFRTATVQVCLSEHEGFWVPALEAMHHRVPVVAYSSTAVTETVGDGGLLLRDKSPATVAAAVHRVVSDQPLREALADAGERHLASFALPVTRECMWQALEPVL